MIVSQSKIRRRFFSFFFSFALFLSLSTGCFAVGILDSAFGSGGVTTTDLGSDAAVHSLLAQSDGRIIVVAKNNGKYVLLRYHLSGALDPSFGGGSGKIVTSYNSADAKVSVNILSNGLFAVGNQSSVVRYDETGNVISSAVFPAGDLTAFRPDGKIVTASLIANPLTQFCTDQPKVISAVTYNENGSQSGISQIVCGSGSNGIQSLNSLVPNPDNTVYVGAQNLASNASAGVVCAFSDTGSFCGFALNGRAGYTLINVTSQADSRYISLSNHSIIRGKTGSSVSQVYDLLGSTQKPFTRIHGNRKVAALRGNESMLVLNEDFTLNGVASTSLYFAGAAEQNSVFVQADDKIIVAGQISAADGRKNIRLIRFSNVLNSAAPNFDFDADNKGDLSVFRSSNATWFTQRSSAGFTAVQWGVPTDTPVSADYDGDGKFDHAVFRPSEGNWYLLLSSNNQFRAAHFGANGDKPVAADYDGDGRADLAVYRDGIWYFLDSSNNQFRAVQFGVAGDKPVPADYDGDGRADVAVYRDGVWYWLQSSDNAFRTVQFGVASDKPATGDYDGDGQADQAVYRSGVWFLNRSRLGFAAVSFGSANDVPVPADYDGDGRTDIAFFRNGVWHLQRSTQGTIELPFGLPDDIPVTTSK